MPAFAQNFCRRCMLETQVLSEHFAESKEGPWKLEPFQIGWDLVMKNKKSFDLSRQRLKARSLQSSHSSSGARDTLGASQLVRCRGYWKALPLQRWFQFFPKLKGGSDWRRVEWGSKWEQCAWWNILASVSQYGDEQIPYLHIFILLPSLLLQLTTGASYLCRDLGWYQS